MVFAFLKLRGVEVEILFCDDAFMRQQNKKHMGHAKTTDVLSFPTQSVKQSQIGDSRIFSGQFLGDILISSDQVKRQAMQQGLSFRREALYLIIHSILHLIGHDHATEAEQRTMHGLESKIWQHLLRKKTA